MTFAKSVPPFARDGAPQRRAASRIQCWAMSGVADPMHEKHLVQTTGWTLALLLPLPFLELPPTLTVRKVYFQKAFTHRSTVFLPSTCPRNRDPLRRRAAILFSGSSPRHFGSLAISGRRANVTVHASRHRRLLEAYPLGLRNSGSYRRGSVVVGGRSFANGSMGEDHRLPRLLFFSNCPGYFTLPIRVAFR